jgi:CubicO group peptidase (beta-lactamase class C family)
LTYSFDAYLSFTISEKHPMKSNPSLILLLALIIQGCLPATEKNRTMSSRLDSLIDAVPGFSGVLLVAEKGKPLYHKAFGYRDFAAKTPIDTSTIFELASVSKPFTAMIIMMLQEDGQLSVDDPLEKYLPDLPYHHITIRHLLNHTSGLPDYQQVMDEHWDKTRIAGNPEILEYLQRYHPDKLFEPGDKYLYSNTGYVLLASIAEKATGKDFIELCRERIFNPVGMTSTNIRTLEEKAALPDVALGHLYVPEKERYIRADSFPSSDYTIWLGNRKGPGRITSTTTDLLKWDRALYSGTLVKRESMEQAFTPGHLNNDSLTQYGYGWQIRSQPTLGRVIWHDGSNPGYKTIILRYIDADKTVIILCNMVPEKFFDLVTEIENALPVSDRQTGTGAH